jgi:predicted nucleic acid-binding protein
MGIPPRTRRTSSLKRAFASCNSHWPDFRLRARRRGFVDFVGAFTLRRPKPERKVLAFVASQPLELLYVSAVTFAEIRFGIELVTDAGRRVELNDWLAHKVKPMFEQRVLAITEGIMFKWRVLVEDGRRAGYTFSQPDLIIAATALHHGLTVVSRDVSDYQKARAPIMNPWSDQPPGGSSRPT